MWFPFLPLAPLSSSPQVPEFWRKCTTSLSVESNEELRESGVSAPITSSTSNPFSEYERSLPISSLFLPDFVGRCSSQYSRSLWRKCPVMSWGVFLCCGALRRFGNSDDLWYSQNLSRNLSICEGDRCLEALTDPCRLRASIEVLLFRVSSMCLACFSYSAISDFFSCPVSVSGIVPLTLVASTSFWCLSLKSMYGLCARANSE